MSRQIQIGTLIVVVLRAVRVLVGYLTSWAVPDPTYFPQKHLPNKRHIGKQDPYCVVVFDSDKRRTKAIKRGGQHPEWDEEIRFSVFEESPKESERATQGGDDAPPPPPKDKKRSRNIKGGSSMRISCWADDAREPDFIGEATVNLNEVFTKGETDGKTSSRLRIKGR